MEFALFYEIPVARPWQKDSEYRAYKDTVEQAVVGEQAGFDSIWTVEHHFLEEFSHCSNPEVLYGNIAARYAASGCDVLFCLVNPYNIPHDRVMRSIELLGEHVIPALR